MTRREYVGPMKWEFGRVGIGEMGMRSYLLWGVMGMLGTLLEDSKSVRYWMRSGEGREEKWYPHFKEHPSRQQPARRQVLRGQCGMGLV